MSDEVPQPPLRASQAAPATSGDRGLLPIQVLGGSPTDEETAAIAALFSSLLLEQAVSSRALPEASPRSAWDREERAIRAPFPAERRWQDR